MKKQLIIFLLIFTGSNLISQNTLIPDSNFEQRLIDLGYDFGPIDGMVLTSNINSITELIVPNSNISDLTGIEDFASLTRLDCIGNPINSLDTSSNSALIHLYTGNNTIASITVTSNLLLETLVLSGHQLTTLDLSNNTALKILSCNVGILSSLDLSNNIALESLDCSDNLLSYLDLKNASNGILITMQADNNTLSCIQVDDEVAATSGTGAYSGWLVDLGVTYSENCIVCPEMEIQGNTIPINSGDNTPDVTDDTDYGNVAFGNFLDHTFTIENTGPIDLNLTGTPLIDITNSVDFTIVTPPNSIVSANGGTTSFVVRYTPSMAGTINTGTLSVANDDCDENPYVFDVKGQSSTLGMNEFEFINQVRVFPNPNRGEFYLDMPYPVEIKRISIYSITGILLNSYKANSLQENSLMRVKDYKGLCFLKIQTQNTQIIKKLVVY